MKNRFKFQVSAGGNDQKVNQYRHEHHGKSEWDHLWRRVYQSYYVAIFDIYVLLDIVFWYVKRKNATDV